MRRITYIALGFLASLALAGCSDDTTTTTDSGKHKEGGKKDTGPGSDAVTEGTIGLETGTADLGDGGTSLCKKFSGYIGKTCTSDTDCTGGGADYFCLGTSSTGGICTVECTPDDQETPLVNEDSCPSAGIKAGTNACSSIGLTSGKTLNLCVRVCAPRIGCSDCDKGVACDPRSGAAVDLYGLAVCLYGGCTKDSECYVETSTTCDPSATTSGCGTSETCLAYWSYEDSTGATTYSSYGVCSKSGTCDTKSGLCDKKSASLSLSTAKVGDACKDDTQCGAEMKCLMEYDESKYFLKTGSTCKDDSQCCGGSCNTKTGKCDKAMCLVRNRNGYCTTQGCTFASTLTGKKCDSGSICNNAYSGGFCQLKCTMATASTCRGNSKDYWGDYECLGWDTPGWTTAPVCDIGTGFSCDVFASSNAGGIDAGTPKYDCGTFFGDSTNSTNMGCRTLDGVETTDKWDPNGFCYDDTGSGTTYRSPTPMLPDAKVATPDQAIKPDSSVKVDSATVPCGPIGPVGCCTGTVLKYCNAGSLATQDCASSPSCGWSAGPAKYSCGTAGTADPGSDAGPGNPMACP